MNNAGAQNPVQYHFRFQFILILLNLLFLYCTHSSHCSHFFNVTFAFTIVFNLVCLLNETGRMLQYFELLVFLAEIKLVNELNLRSVGNIINFLDDKNLFRLNFILLFSIFYWLFYFCIVYIENKYFIDPLFFSKTFCQSKFKVSQGRKIVKMLLGFRENCRGKPGNVRRFFSKVLSILSVWVFISIAVTSFCVSHV